MIKFHAQIYLYAIVLPILFGAAGCSSFDDNPSGPPGAPAVQPVLWLPNLVLGSAAFFPLQATPYNISLDQLDSLRATISDSNAQVIATFQLYDDGNAFDLTDNLAFASLRSGDNVPHDALYCRSINSLFTTQPGLFQLQIYGWTKGVSFSEHYPYAFNVAADAPPLLSLIGIPDSLPSAPFLYEIEVLAIDPDTVSGDSVTEVALQLYTPSGSLIDTVYSLYSYGLGDNYYRLPLTPAFAIGRPTGNYTFVIKAFDTYNLVSDSLSHVVFIENLGPNLSELVLPDTIILPTSEDTSYFTATIRCLDDQGVGDISEVKLRTLYMPDSTWGTNFIPMLDDGDLANSGDSSAGDGIYSRSLSIWPSNQIGVYQFHFYGIDKADNQSEIIDSLWVVP
jgi:hypothetical protein